MQEGWIVVERDLSRGGEGWMLRDLHCACGSGGYVTVKGSAEWLGFFLET